MLFAAHRLARHDHRRPPEEVQRRHGRPVAPAVPTCRPCCRETEPVGSPAGEGFDRARHDEARSRRAHVHEPHLQPGQRAQIWVCSVAKAAFSSAHCLNKAPWDTEPTPVHLPLKRATRASNSRAVSAQLFSARTGGQRFPVMIGVIWLAVCSHRISIPLLLSQITCPTREHGDCADAVVGRRSASAKGTTQPIFMSLSTNPPRSDSPGYRLLQ